MLGMIYNSLTDCTFLCLTESKEQDWNNLSFFLYGILTWWGRWQYKFLYQSYGIRMFLHLNFIDIDIFLCILHIKHMREIYILNICLQLDIKLYIMN